MSGRLEVQQQEEEVIGNSPRSQDKKAEKLRRISNRNPAHLRALLVPLYGLFYDERLEPD